MEKYLANLIKVGAQVNIGSNVLNTKPRSLMGRKHVWKKSKKSKHRKHTLTKFICTFASKSICNHVTAIMRLRRHMKAIVSFISLKSNIKMFQRSFPCRNIHMEPKLPPSGAINTWKACPLSFCFGKALTRMLSIVHDVTYWCHHDKTMTKDSNLSLIPPVELRTKEDVVDVEAL